tara:strand:- start:628 stop:1155 length:528 start_codon:yes stop_codon:yes gene_type:complete
VALACADNGETSVIGTEDRSVDPVRSNEWNDERQPVLNDNLFCAQRIERAYGGVESFWRQGSDWRQGRIKIVDININRCGLFNHLIDAFHRCPQTGVTGKGQGEQSVMEYLSNVRFKGDDQRADDTYRGTQYLTSQDVVEAIFWAATLPAHVNINRIQMMPVTQAFAGFDIRREE